MVTVIIPAYNCRMLLPDAVNSALEQTYRPIEVIIVNDGSTDDTRMIAERLACEHKEVHVINKRNEGPGAARESGRGIANGEFVQYLDSDDLLMPSKFDQQVAGLLAHPECCASYGQTLVYRFGESHASGAVMADTQIATIFPRFLRGRLWHTSTPLWRRDALAAAGPWKNYGSWEDWEYECRVARAVGGHLHFVDDIVSHTRVLPASSSECSVQVVSTSRQMEHKHPELFLKGRASALLDIGRHGQVAGVPFAAPEWIYFARNSFWHARRCLKMRMWPEAVKLLHLTMTVISSHALGRSLWITGT